jgi:hypothetical protein
VHRTSENLSGGRNCRAAGVIFGITSGESADVLVTSKKLTQTKQRLVLLRKFTIRAELVDWAERAMMEADFDEADTEVLSEIIGRLGLADVGEFGLRWQDCEEFLRRLGYRAKVIVSTE